MTQARGGAPADLIAQFIREAAHPDENPLDRLAAHVEVLGDPTEWEEPPRFDSLAQAVIGSVWSLGVRWTGVQNVIARYQAAGGGRTPDELVDFIDEVGGPEGFADLVDNRQRTSSRNGILKAEAVWMTAAVLLGYEIKTLKDLASRPLVEVRRDWITVPGQASGLSWDYFLMLVGFEGVKADRMVLRFIADALGEPAISIREAKRLAGGAAQRLGVSLTKLDYQIWKYQRTRGRQGTAGIARRRRRPHRDALPDRTHSGLHEIGRNSLVTQIPSAEQHRALLNDCWDLARALPSSGVLNRARRPYRAIRFERKLDAVANDPIGLLEYVRGMAHRATYGLDSSAEYNRLDLSVEMLIIDESKIYAPLFTPKDRAAAKAKLGRRAEHVRELAHDRAQRPRSQEERIEAIRSTLPADLEQLSGLAAQAVDSEAAIAINSSILERNPRDAVALNRLGRAYEAIGSIDRARGVFQQVLETDPNNQIAVRRLRELNRKR
jgi:tetratricopeptide (TPR) repeat protein